MVTHTQLSDNTCNYQTQFNMCTEFNDSSPRFQNTVCAKDTKCLFVRLFKTKKVPEIGIILTRLKF